MIYQLVRSGKAIEMLFLKCSNSLANVDPIFILYVLLDEEFSCLLMSTGMSVKRM